MDLAVRQDVCGVDEAGRGPWAGPVFAAAVIFEPGVSIDGLDDSKKLTPERRYALEPRIKQLAVSWGVGMATVAEIDAVNILQATGLAMCRAIEALETRPSLALVDGNYAFKLPCEVKTMVGGDGLCAAISAASILAKTARDRLMIDMEGQHPGYGFASHKGYGVRAHAEALEVLGPCAIHRTTFAPVRAAMLRRLNFSIKIDDSAPPIQRLAR